MKVRAGFGYDVHRLVENRKLILGGVYIPFHKGCLAHSDGDALIHAIIDALLGAAGQRDIGWHFPDTSDEFKNIDSRILLQKTFDIIQKEGYRVGNIDCTISLEQPKLKLHIPEMIAVISEILHMPVGALSVKAGTNEKMGFVGTGEGVAVYAVCILEKD